MEGCLVLESAPPYLKAAQKQRQMYEPEQLKQLLLEVPFDAFNAAAALLHTMTIYVIRGPTDNK